MLKVYTSRIGYRGPRGLDVTIKSARGFARSFAPTSWEMVLGAKNGTIPHEEYQTWYIGVLDESRKAHEKDWAKLLGLGQVVLECFCASPPVWCHRRYLSEYLIRHFQAAYMGELAVDARGFPDRSFQFSNFQPVPVRHEGILYPSVEHYYQALKSLDPKERRSVAAAPSPGSAKVMGRGLTVRRDWDDVKLGVMRDGLGLKFSGGSAYADALLRTGDDQLVEENSWHDRFWGRCKCPQHSGAGENHLGRLLMERRSELRTAGNA